MKLSAALLLIACTTSNAYSQERATRDQVTVPADAAAANKKAEDFARSVAEPGTARFSEVFNTAVDLAAEANVSSDRTPDVPRATGIAGKGYRGIAFDRRYNENLKKMLGDVNSVKIYHGQDVPVGAYPDVVAVLGNNRICSGTLVAPDIVVTAVHCVRANVNEKVVFGANAFVKEDTPGARIVKVKESKTMIGPKSALSSGDLAILILSERVDDVPVRRIARPEWIVAAADIRAVGFGLSEDPARKPLGIKRVVDVPIASHSCSGTVQFLAGPIDDSAYYQCGRGIELVAGAMRLGRDTCGGDSGGPAMVRGPDGLYYLAAATSRAIIWPKDPTPSDCGDGGLYARVDTAVTWMNANGASGLTIADAPPIASIESRSLFDAARRTTATRTDGPGWSAATMTSLPLYSDRVAMTGGPNAAEAGSASSAPASNQPRSRPAEAVANIAAGRQEVRPAIADLPRVDAPATDPVIINFLRSIGAAGQVHGSLVEPVAGAVFLVPEWNDELRVPVLNAGALPRNSFRLPVTLGVTVTPGGVEVREISLTALADWKANPGNWAKPELRGVNAFFERLNRTAMEFFAADRVDWKPEFRQDIKETRSAIARAYVVASSPAAKKDLRKAFRQVEYIRKAISGKDDRYRPLAYQRIFDNSRGSVALAKKNSTEAFCSGVLVAQDVIMTARHCTEGLPQDMDVWFNYELDLDNRPLTADIYPVESFLYRGVKVFEPDGPNLDVALVRVGRNAIGQLPGQKWPVQCVSSQRLTRDEPIYIVGHPEGRFREIHDFTFVKFPFEASQDEFDILLTYVEAEFEDSVDHDQFVGDFKNSYRADRSAPYPVYRNYAVRWKGQPTVAIDSDTFEGDSGAPVYHRVTNRVVALFAGGVKLLDYPAGYRYYEAAIPMGEIIKQLEKNYPGWASDIAVCVDSLHTPVAPR